MCGSEVEGILKQHIYKGGEYHDIIIMGMYESRWKEMKKECKYTDIEFLV